jgi:hypothetical protein
MNNDKPVLEYAIATKQKLLPWQAIAALPPLLCAPMTMCMCGHTNWFTFPFSLAAATLSGWAWGRKDYATLGRLVVIVLVVLASLLLFKNVADVLWFGHDALLRRSR